MGTISNSSKSDNKTIYLGGLTSLIDLSKGDEFKVINCYNAGKIIISDINDETIIYSGNITAEHQAGTIQNCYYEKNDVAGIGKHDEENCIDDIIEVESLYMKTREMVEKLNGDEDVYYYDERNINKGYPILKYQYMNLLRITSDEYEIDNLNLYITNIKPETTIKDFKANLETNATTIEIYKAGTKITDENAKLGTGMIIKFSLNDEQIEYTVVVTGDLNGDGQMGNVDLLKLVRYKVGLDTNLSGVYLEATDVHKDNKYGNDLDILKMARVIVGLDSL